MTRLARSGVAALVVLVALASAPAAPHAGDLPAIEKVEIRDRAFYVNGEPFFPLMAWLQDPKNFPAVRACGMNATAGYYPKSGGTRDVTEYLPLVRKAGLYGVMPFDGRLKDHASLLAYIHGDEPDLPHSESDAEVVAASDLRINRSTPLWKLVDGVAHSWSVLDPLEGAAVTVRRREPVTAVRVAVCLTVSKGLAVAKDVVFEADGKAVLEAALRKAKGAQTFDLPKPATFRALTLRVRSTYPGEQVWGSMGEIAAFDADGRNVLVSPPRQVPRATPEQTLRQYRAIKAENPSRPVLMTLTGYFHPHFNKWPTERREALYRGYVQATDVVGFDIYPIYGWNKPEWIHLVHDATAMLTEMAGPRPVYAWIETSRGGQYTGPLEKQKEVTPRHIRAEVWMAICGGATGIGYFTHVWKPSYNQFGVPEASRKALAGINAQITRLAPAILGKACAGKVAATEPKAKVAALFRSHQGARYAFAVNYDERPAATRATIEVPGLTDGAAVEVVDEDRTLKADAGGFSDTFDPLAVHMYRVAAAGATAPSSESGAAAKTEEGAKPSAEDQAGFVPLFPKEGVPEGWRVGYYSDVSKPPPKGATWTVRDGVLHGSEPRATWLFSEKTYGDFILECEFRLNGNGNSGIGLRFPDAGDPAFMGLELQIVDPEYYAGFKTTPDQFTGSLYGAVAPKKQVYKPGEWNRYRITLRGSKVHVVLNGELIQDLDLAGHTEPLTKGEPLAKRPRRGHIGFQELSRTGKHVQFRNVRIKVLDE